jgi:hypothetical protein
MKFHIPHCKRFIFVSNWLVSTLFVSYWPAFTFFIMNTDSGKSANISRTIHIMKKVPKQSSMHVHNGEGRSAIYYLHHEDA